MSNSIFIASLVRIINTFIGEFSMGTDLKTEVFVKAGFMESYIVDHQSLLKVSII